MPKKNIAKHGPGTVYAFKVAANTYGFARLKFSIPKSIYLAEVFNCSSAEPNFTTEICSSNILIPYECIYPAVLVGKPWNWQIIAMDPDYKGADNKELENLELVTGICEASRFNPSFKDGCGAPLWTHKRRLTEDEYRAMNDSPISMNRALNPHRLVVDLRKRWGLQPFEWLDIKSMAKQLIEEGVYTPSA